MTDGLAVSEEVARSVERVRWAVLIFVLLCAIATQVLAPPPAPRFAGSNLGLGAALACAFVAIVARGVSRGPSAPPRTRVRALLAAYVASALLGVVALGIFYLQGDPAQAVGAALGGAIFAATGARQAPARPPRP